MVAVSDSSVYEVPGLHVHNMQEETTSINGWEGLREQVASTFCECNCQGSWLGRAPVKRCFGCSRLREPERCGKIKTGGLQSDRGAPGKLPMGFRVKEEKITQNIKCQGLWLERATVKRCFKCSRLREAERCGKVKTGGLQSDRGAPGNRCMGFRVEEEEVTQNIKFQGSWLGRVTVKICFRCSRLRETERCDKAKTIGLQSGLGAPCKRCMGFRVKEEEITQNIKCQGPWLGRATVKRCFRCSRLREAERCGKVKTGGLQSDRGAPCKHCMGFRVKEEEITQNIKPKTIHTSSMAGLGDMEIPRSSCDVKYPPRDVIVIEDDRDNGDNENGNDSKQYTDNLINSNEDDDHDLTSDGDASSTKNLRSISCGSTGQRFNLNSHQIPKSTNHSKDEDDCQIFGAGRFRPFKRMKSAHRQNPTGNDRYVRERLSSDSDSADYEIIMEGSSGKIHEQWEQAALKKQLSFAMKYKRPIVEEEFSVSGSNFCPDSSSREFEQGKNEQAYADFQKHHSDRYSTDPPDLVSASGIVYTSCQEDVRSHRIPKEPETKSQSRDLQWSLH